MNKKIFVLVIALIMALLLGLFLSFYFAERSAKQPIRYSDSSDMIKTAVGEKFSIALRSNWTTGYKWQLAEPVDKNMLEFVGLEYEEEDNRLVGSGGTEVWTFKAVGKGKTSISFKYARPWEDIPSAQSETFLVEIH